MLNCNEVNDTWFFDQSKVNQSVDQFWDYNLNVPVTVKKCLHIARLEQSSAITNSVTSLAWGWAVLLCCRPKHVRWDAHVPKVNEGPESESTASTEAKGNVLRHSEPPPQSTPHQGFWTLDWSLVVKLLNCHWSHWSHDRPACIATDRAANWLCESE